MGNPIVRNDQIGLLVGDRLATVLAERVDTSVREFTGSPLDLVSELEGHDAAILVDSVCTGSHPPGTVFLFSRDELLQTRLEARPHSVNIGEALALADRLGLPGPDRLWLLGIETGPIDRFGADMSQELSASVPLVLERTRRVVADLLEEVGRNCPCPPVP
jgi:hydrogenase maturation protease